jgi:hypothetical protein
MARLHLFSKTTGLTVQIVRQYRPGSGLGVGADGKLTQCAD